MRTDNTLIIANALFDKKTYDAIVAPSGGDYTSLRTAITAGKTNIFVRKGTYQEVGNITITTENVRITWEDKYSTKILFPVGTNGIVLYSNYALIKGLYIDTFTNSGASALVIGDWSPTPWTPDYTKGNYNVVDDCYIRGRDAYGEFSLYVAWDSTAAGAATVAAFDANTMATGNVIKNCIIEGHQAWDVAVFALQKNWQFINNKVIWGRFAYYMVRNCQADVFVEDSEAEGVFMAWPSYNNTLRAVVVNPTNSGFTAENQLEHTVAYPAYSLRNNDISINVTDTLYSGVTVKNFDENNLTINVDGANFHWLYMEKSKNNNIPFVQIRNPRQDVANSRGSGVYFVDSVIDNNFWDVTIIETKTVNSMHIAFANREDSTCTGNKINNLTTRGLSTDRNVWIQSKNWKIVNADIQGGAYAWLYLNGATYWQFDNVQCKNNTNDANNSYAEVWITWNSTNNVIGKLITESTAANKAKYWVQIDSWSNNNYVFNHQNIWAVTTAELNSGAGNSIGITVTWMTVRNVIQQNLASNFNAVTGTAEQEVTGLRLTLPVISGTCTVKITSKVYLNTVAWDNSMRIRTWSDTSVLTNNTQQDNWYVGWAKSLETYTAVVVASLDLSSQQYVFYSIQNGTDALNLSLSASWARSTMVVEVYK